MRYYKTIQITLTEPEYADVMKACAREITETGTPVSVTRYAKSVLMDACATHASLSAYADQDEVQQNITEE